jgi:hypothetical protein
VKRNASSSSQYQSEDSWVRLLKRSWLLAQAVLRGQARGDVFGRDEDVGDPAAAVFERELAHVHAYRAAVPRHDDAVGEILHDAGVGHFHVGDVDAVGMLRRPEVVHGAAHGVFAAYAVQAFGRLVPGHHAQAVVHRFQVHRERHVVDDVVEKARGLALLFLDAPGHRGVARGAAVTGERVVLVEHRHAAGGKIMRHAVAQHPDVFEITESLARLQHRAVVVPGHAQGVGAGQLPAALAEGAVEVGVGAGAARAAFGAEVGETVLGILLPVPVRRNRRQAAQAVHVVPEFRDQVALLRQFPRQALVGRGQSQRLGLQALVGLGQGFVPFHHSPRTMHGQKVTAAGDPGEPCWRWAAVNAPGERDFMRCG